MSATKPAPHGRRHDPTTSEDHPVERPAARHCPLTLTIAAPVRMLNLELPSHPVYDAAELVWFDDAERGTGMLAFLTRRPDRVVDHYVQPGLRLTPEDFHLGGGSRSWNVTDIDPARLEIGPDGVVAAASFVDVDGRRIELAIDDRDGRRRRRSSLLAPVSADIEVPQSLLVIWMPTFDLVRVTDPPATIRIDGEPVETHRIPLERLHRQRIIKYTSDLLAVEVNREGTRELGTGPGEAVLTPDGRAIRAVVAGRDGHRARLLLWPPLPDLTTLRDGELVTGRWGLQVDEARLVAGPWSARRSADRVELDLDTDTPWQPRGLPWLLWTLTRVVPAFRRWPTTYRWRATVDLTGPLTVTGRWERTDGTRRR